MKKHKLLSISAVIMMLSAYGCSLDEFNPSGISTEQEWSTPAGYEKKVNDCYFDLVRIVYGQAEDTYLMVAEVEQTFGKIRIPMVPTVTGANYSVMKITVLPTVC